MKASPVEQKERYSVIFLTEQWTFSYRIYTIMDQIQLGRFVDFPQLNLPHKLIYLFLWVPLNLMILCKHKQNHMMF